MTGTTPPLPLVGASSIVFLETPDQPARVRKNIRRVRTNMTQRPSAEKRGASSESNRAGGLVSLRTGLPSGRSSQIERCCCPKPTGALLGPAAAASRRPEGAHDGDTQLSGPARLIVRWRQAGGPVWTSSLSVFVSRFGPAAAISRRPHQLRKSG